MAIKDRFGSNVRRFRERAGLSQDALAHTADLHRVYLSGIERGKRSPSIETVEKLANALGIGPGELFADQPDDA